MKRDTFLSIDIDYWNHLPYPNCVGGMVRYLNELAHLCKEQRIKLTCVMNHQQMLPKVNASKARKLVNLDTHSDMADPSVECLDCGSWVGFVSWRREGHFHWIHAEAMDIGECSGNVRGVPMFRAPGPAYSSNTDWEKITHARKLAPPNLNQLLPTVREVCVCSSPDFAEKDLYRMFMVWKKEHNIPYTKGRRDEGYGCEQTPPYSSVFLQNYAYNPSISQFVRSRAESFAL